MNRRNTDICPVCKHPVSDHDRQYGCNHDQCECEYHPSKIAPRFTVEPATPFTQEASQ